MKSKIAIFTITTFVLLGAMTPLALANPTICDPSQEPCVVPLVVEKTAQTSFNRDWQWKIRKIAYQKERSLTEDQMTAVNYQIKVGALPKDGGWRVSGTITIINPETNPDAEVTGLTDVLSSFGAITNLNCDVNFPHLLPAGDTITCTYDQRLTKPVNQTNTASVQTVGAVPGGSATAGVIFSATPTTETDRCVTVSDTNSQGPQGSPVCADESIKTIKYHVTFGQNDLADVSLSCGDTNYSNTASFITNDTEKTGESTVTSSFHVECPKPFCSFSQGYWFAKPGISWPDVNGEGSNGEVTIGSSDYTQSDGTTVRNSSNAGGIPDLKKGFLQFVAIKLSQANNPGSPLPDDLSAQMDIINDNWGSKTVDQIIDNSNQAEEIAIAGGWIGDWIDENHCAEELE